MVPASGALALQIFQLIHVDDPRRGRVGSMETARHRADQTWQLDLPIDDVQRPLVDIERGFSHSFA